MNANGITAAVGEPRPRVEGRLKVTGSAAYVADVPMPDLAHGWMVTATVSRGRIRDIDATDALAMPGVLGVLDHRNARRLNPDAAHHFGPDRGLPMLQDDAVPYAGRPIALVVARTPEQARAAASALRVTYDAEPHDTEFSMNHPAARPASTLFGPEADTGDLEAELAVSTVVVDEVYRTPEENHSAMEPHVATAWWEDGHLYALDSNQGPFSISQVMAMLFFIDRDRVHIRAEHVGGGFGAKTICGAQIILAAMAAEHFRRPVRVALTRRQVFLAIGSRPPTEQRVRIGAGADGRLRAVHHHAAFALSPLAEYIEWCTEQARTLYAAPAIRTELSAVPLDRLPPCTMRGPGATPGSFAFESAVDEVAERLRIDPLRLRLLNQPAASPVSGRPWSTRRLITCLEEGARRFGWAQRDPRPRLRREGNLLVGTGVAAAAFVAGVFPASATIAAETDGTFSVRVGASDIGTGARTALIAVAADALGVSTERIRLHIGDSDLGPNPGAGGSRGTTSCAFAVTEAAKALREKLDDPARPVTVTVDTTPLINWRPAEERNTYSAVFAEVTVDPATGEVRVRRLLGMFAVGRVINPLLARSQLIGGMIGGLSMALHEESVRDPITGRLVTADFAGYHISAHADVPNVEADFVADYEPQDPSGFNGLGEIGNAGVAAAIANAVWHATGTRHRTLPISLGRVVETAAPRDRQEAISAV
ncbi:xanthine dehydrogenase family protein molybdopterin-binding subunit [Phytohabitans sp. ZYX-F-186]|uniref:Xanthine dehydrogenase family protein molybdopterin-binding subunit n=1 Tax=Phytohabitans maris TaxID=3071409 RepID=A0ABU0ZUM4_9ACTN|nr:xanthine dehydrogenase family protein molybdopterin-binding subunit [Phytohabitans sp. ZYX-F-186]MDQ7909875.1 xanthine dehydrogenase family protein molybdopterin-binding subunit [Phytohabitans sp. ZYX-F-186]